jgi:ATP-binding cassette subfamily F protein 3
VPTHVTAGPAGLDLNPPLSVARGDARGELVIGGLNMQLYRGERLGIVGPNGCGKTTLLRLLTRQLAPLKGMVAWGSNAELGVFSQDSADLSEGNDLIAELRSVEPTITDSAARDYLGRFGFSGDDVFAEVSTLSGGERSRLTLAKIFRRRPNVLIFDEPTNHLDIYAREALEQLLLSYGGTVLMVTHDRALLERVCDRLVVFPFGAEDEQTLTFFRGSYADYLTWRTRRDSGPAEESTGRDNDDGRPGVEQGAIPDPSQPERLSVYDVELLAKEAHVSPEAYAAKQLARAHSRAEQVEQAIAEAEGQINQLMEAQREADTAQDYVRLAELQEQIDGLKAGIDARFAELEQVHARAEAWQRLAAQV